jgi:predicted nuclease with RNAse H fold
VPVSRSTLGIDVGVRKGLDLILLTDSREVIDSRRGVRVDELAGIIHAASPNVVAIDSPPWWSAGLLRSRHTELKLRGAGILSFSTPTRESGETSGFYDWMRVGFDTFAIAAACGYPRYRGGNVERTAIEVFPHATAVTLAGHLGPPRWEKRPWRRQVLSEHGVDPTILRGPDQVDAALAALTGLFALEGRFCAPGDPNEGAIVLPVLSLPEQRYRREVS